MKSVVLTLSFLFLLKIFLVRCENATVSYFVDLIQNETSHAFLYNLPTNASEFQPKYDAISTYGIYDYIIVGAGSTGAVIANRLSENSKEKVLLLEAGGDESDFTDIPGMNIFLQGLEYNWNYKTVPQTTSCLGMFNQECAYPRGKGLGGTSILNSLMYVRGNKEDFNRWYRQGNTGWSYKDVLSYFIKSENSNIDGDRGYHGVGGNLNVEYHKTDNPQFSAFIKANVELGNPIVDYNGKQQLGVAKTQLNTIRGRRDSTNKAFLKPAIGRSNLKVLTHSFVVKILIDPISNVAHGVLFSHQHHLYKVWARKEVIISAGAIGSPHLLMLSGIGPYNHLRKLGIPVIKSLPVGQNFQDHAAYYALHIETNYTIPNLTSQEKVKQYLNGYGPYAIPGNAEGLGFYQTKKYISSPVPDIELIFIGSNSSSPIFQRAYHYNDETYNSIYKKVNPSNTFAFYMILLHPKSRGDIKLKSRNPYIYPLINSRFLSDPDGEDIETMYQGIQVVMKLINTNAMKKINATLVYSPLPACKGYKYPSRQFWYCQLRQLTFHISHPAGTCKMGPNPRKGAVVDHQLRVHGIKKLRVADASIFPDMTSGHPNAVCIMIGEKVADMIKGARYKEEK